MSAPSVRRSPHAPAATQPFPVLTLRNTLVFPLGALAVQVGTPENVALLENVVADDGYCVVLCAPQGNVDAAALVNRVVVLVRVGDFVRLPSGTAQVTLQGLARRTITQVTHTTPYLAALTDPVLESPLDTAAAARLARQLVQATRALVDAQLVGQEVPGLLEANSAQPARLLDLAATHTGLSVDEREQLIQAVDLEARFALLFQFLETQRQQAQVREETERAADLRMTRQQREAHLRQQLRVIQAELGEGEGSDRDLTELATRLAQAGMPTAVHAEATRELARLRLLSPSSSEYGVARTYLDWLLAMPWPRAADAGDASGPTDPAIAAVRRHLDAAHFGLDDVKRRILEYLAVRQRTSHEGAGPILCLVGPPGTGKTSLGEAIAEALGRPFARVAVGGARDEADIRGHRRTYVGAMPGRIIQALRRAGSATPVLLIDEIDKMGRGGMTGDPTAAMLEVLDPKQNRAFTDHYLNVPFDCSGVLFLCTANSLDTIPAPLRDRMEVIRLAGYTIEEKLAIAQHHVLPAALRAHGLAADDIVVSEDCLRTLITRYAREAGVRILEQRIAALLRHRALALAEGATGTWTVTAATLDEVLGAPSFPEEEAEQAPEVGTANGLAWTSHGGCLMTPEVLVMPGTGECTVTGQLGSVMRESVDAAVSYVRARAADLGIPAARFRDSDLHIHFPEGAVPKDGPSAGITLTLCLASALSGRPVRRDVAMTGEVTLRGKVLAIGGVKEKVLAAHRAGIREVLLPARNARDVREIPDAVRETMTLTFVDTMEAVFAHALLGAPAPATAPHPPVTRPPLPELDLAVVPPDAEDRDTSTGVRVVTADSVPRDGTSGTRTGGRPSEERRRPRRTLRPATAIPRGD